VLTNGPDEVEPADFHYEWSRRLLEGTDNTAIEGHRESAKSNYVLRSFLLYSLVFASEKRDYIVIIKKNDTLARNVLKDVEREAESNPIIEANVVKVYECSGDAYSVDRLNDEGEIVNVRVEAYGKGAAIRGLANRDRRPKIVIVDDPQDPVDARSETVQVTDWDWFLSDVMFLGQKTRIFLIGNNLGERCIIERVFANAESLGFATMKVPCIIDGRPAWPAKYTLEEIDREKAAYRDMGKLDVWLREKMCEAVGEETRVFAREDYRYYTAALAPKLVEGCNLYATLDPASSPEISSCYRAICVNAVDYDNRWQIVDMPYGRWDSAELIDQMFAAVTKWRLKRFGIEKGIFKQVLEPFIYKEMSRRNVFFDIIPIEHAKRGSKLERIKMLQPRFKAHNVWFPDDSPPWLVELETELAGVTKDAIKSMFIDLADSLAMMEQIASAPYGRQKISEIPREAVTEYEVFSR